MATKNSIQAVNKNFATVKDQQLQKAVVDFWKQERSISGLTRFIVKNFDSCKELKELLLRKGYKKADFGKVDSPDFNFVLSHMSDKAKFQLERVKVEDPTVKPSYQFKLDAEGNKIPRSIYQLSTVLNELRKIDNKTV